ncbi:MAG: tRNA pseudouridine(55) synthase TruB [Desulfovibrio sp.]|jgi:tRNA pseudouridine55 synthase|nr:tRNA pseudouridine(55) synthase TruB [Desulfovibrio sp.]
MTDARRTVSTPTLPQLDGIVVLNKPSGLTSTRCLNILKRMGQKKIGHAGTLDPMARGVLLVLLGCATKLSSWLLGAGHKVYAGELKLGVETDTWDTEGEVFCEKSPDGVGSADVAAEIRAWTELTSQDVPPYSAAKHQGKPLYQYARKGRPAPAKVKEIKIHSADMLDFSMPVARFRVVCDSGAYIRSLAHSLGKRLGCGAALCGLTREYSHPFSLEQAVDLAEIEADPAILKRIVRPVEDALPHWPKIELDAASARRVKNGMPVRAENNAAEHAFLCHEGRACALASLAADEYGPCWKVARGL